NVSCLEVGAITEETEACDWWSLGAILFELLTGKTLVECHPSGINTHTSLSIPDHVSKEARSLIQQVKASQNNSLGSVFSYVENCQSSPVMASSAGDFIVNTSFVQSFLRKQSFVFLVIF
ncbi:UNVERIFIED_CONTAM: hypothetical protein H355_015201, partial [Colinus virginianus]